MEHVDVLIVGAGAAGIPAALFASKTGARVVLADAASCAGGTFYLSSGQMSAAGTRLQAQKGIDDSPQKHFDDVMRINRNTADPDLVRLAVENAADTLHWLLDNGLQLLPEHPVVHFGHEPYETPRTYWAEEGGLAIWKILRPLLEASVAAGQVDLRLDTKLSSISRNEDSVRVTLEHAGRRYEVTAGSVVLATGGYASNPELFSELSGGKPLYGGANDYSLGQGLVAARNIGARVVNRDYYLPSFAAVPCSSAQGGYTFLTQTYPQFRQPWEVYVNSDGKRFMREDDPSVDRRERELLKLPGMRFWAIFDESIRQTAPSFFTKHSWEEIAPRFNKDPAFQCADSLTELAARIDCDESTLQHSIREFNAAIDSGLADSFGREHRPLALKNGPFYAVEHVGWSIVGFAGLGVNAALRVVDESGDAINGLYAAGEILGMGATSGDAFTGGMSVTPAMTFGRLLGQRLAQAHSRSNQTVQIA
ncbi:MAG: fumarate reductase flavoprotein subunit [Halieaceae bacterium]|jgi:fumarate reductase flavoprotein subunit